MNLEFIFKVIDKEEWQKAKQSGTYGGSEKDIKDGYIHFSEEDQVEETLKKHYPKKENLLCNSLLSSFLIFESIIKSFSADTISITSLQQLTEELLLNAIYRAIFI